MKNRLSSIILALAIISAVSCKAPGKKPGTPEGEPERSYYGKAVIKNVSESKDDSLTDKKGYVEIHFDFIPSDPKAPEKYLCRECPDRDIKLFYDNRESFHLNWVKKWDIKPGNEYPAIRHEMMRKDKTAPVSHEVILDPVKQE